MTSLPQPSKEFAARSFALLAACIVAFPSAAHASQASTKPARADSQSEERPTRSSPPPPYEELLHRVEEGDAAVRDLLRRVEALEKALASKSAAGAGAGGQLAQEPQSSGTAQSKAPANQPARTSATQTQTEVHPEQDPNLRALERTLVEQGGLLVPRGSFEIEPQLMYTHKQTQGLEVISISPGGAASLDVVNRRAEALDAELMLRGGLPFESQLELLVPYAYRDQVLERTFAQTEQSRHDSGLGDVQLTLSKQWLQERPGLPSLLTSLNWKTTTGST